MNFIFFGTPEFAAIILQKLIDSGFAPIAVVCNPDRPVGRKKIITPPPAKLLAEKHGIKVFQPEKLSSDVRCQMSDVGADFAVVASYARIIPKDIIDLFPKGMIGIHPSLLPKYRGPTPIQSVILDGAEETGVTLYLLDEKVDHGPIIAMQKSKIQNQNYKQLVRELAELSGNLLIETLHKFIAGKIQPISQDESQATYTKKFSTEDAFIPPEDLERALAGDLRLAESIDRKIRALNPEPGVWTLRPAPPNTRRGEQTFLNKARGKQAMLPQQNQGKRMKLLEAELKNNRLVLKKIQIEGEKPKNLG